MPKNLGLYNDDLSTPRKKDVDACYGPNNAPPYPVTSVNGQTGGVNLTASDVGAAPGGYGLGSAGVTSLLDANTANKNGWYMGRGENAVNFPSYNYKYGELFVLTRNSTIEQFAIFHGTICVRYSTDGGTTWNPGEYVNPPMEIGAEYRTTERYLGKPVYVMVVDCGVAPSKGETWIKINKEISRFISIDAVSYASDTYQTTIPDSVESCKAVLVMSSQSPYILVKTTTDNFAVNGYHIYARIKYTKSTD